VTAEHDTMASSTTMLVRAFDEVCIPIFRFLLKNERYDTVFSKTVPYSRLYGLAASSSNRNITVSVRLMVEAAPLATGDRHIIPVPIPHPSLRIPHPSIDSRRHWRAVKAARAKA
jgi:hypothetical protein